MKKLGRILAVVAGLALGVVTVGTGASAYEVTPCSSVNSPPNVVTYVESPANNPGFDGTPVCPGGGMAQAWGATNPGDNASLRFEAPPGTGFLGVNMEYQNPSYNGVSSRFIFNNAGGANTEVASIPTHMVPLPWFDWYEVSDNNPRSIFRATLKCELATPCGSGSRIGYYDIKFRMTDTEVPSYAGFLGGTLFNPGTVSGTRTAQLGGTDNGSGIRWITMNVNDVWSYVSGFTCSNPGLRPCPRDPTTTFNVDTGGANFVNGVNKITVCVQDLSANAKCEHRYINVAK